MADVAQNTQVTVKDDSKELINQATLMLTRDLATVKSHFYAQDSKMKASCSVTIEFSLNKEEAVIIKIVPKSVLPQEPKEFLGEFTSKGELTLI
jgi:hypothetical protein